MNAHTALILLSIWGVVITVVLLVKILNAAQRQNGRRFPRGPVEPYQHYVDTWNATHPNDELEGWRP